MNLMITNINKSTVTKNPAQCNQLRIYNKDFILVTYQQVVLLYITVIECKTLNDHRVQTALFVNCGLLVFYLSEACTGSGERLREVARRDLC